MNAAKATLVVMRSIDLDHLDLRGKLALADLIFYAGVTVPESLIDAIDDDEAEQVELKAKYDIFRHEETILAQIREHLSTVIPDESDRITCDILIMQQIELIHPLLNLDLTVAEIYARTK